MNENVKPIKKLTLAELQILCHLRSSGAGWWDDYHKMPPEYRKYFLASRIALIHSEASEALEGMRKNKMDDHLPHRRSIEVEFADLVIRILDMSDGLELDLIGAIEEKLDYNARREDHSREHRASEGGKSL